MVNLIYLICCRVVCVFKINILSVIKVGVICNKKRVGKYSLHESLSPRVNTNMFFLVQYLQVVACGAQRKLSATQTSKMFRMFQNLMKLKVMWNIMSLEMTNNFIRQRYCLTQVCVTIYIYCNIIKCTASSYAGNFLIDT